MLKKSTIFFKALFWFIFTLILNSLSQTYKILLIENSLNNLKQKSKNKFLALSVNMQIRLTFKYPSLYYLE